MRLLIAIPVWMLAAPPNVADATQSNAQEAAVRFVTSSQSSQPQSQPQSQPHVRLSTGPVRRVEANAAAGPLRDELEVVDAGSEDVGPLGTSLRRGSTDVRMPAAFQRVYRVPGEDDKFMRGNGALFAVFPASVYRLTQRGLMPTTPAGTVYRIGMPGQLHLAPKAPEPRMLGENQIDGRVPLRITPVTHSGAARFDTRIDARLPALESAPLGSPVAAPAPEATEQGSAAHPDFAPIVGNLAEPYAHLRFGAPRVHRD